VSSTLNSCFFIFLFKPGTLKLLCRYILIYPQGCDVCNHISLFLCVANHDKLLPGMRHLFCSFWAADCKFFDSEVLLNDDVSGWSHFAQFTIAVVNKDPKKSKYSGWFIRERHFLSDCSPPPPRKEISALHEVPSTFTQLAELLCKMA
jgi:hypothetical protein